MNKDNALMFLANITKIDRALLVQFIKDPSICRWAFKEQEVVKILTGMNAYMVYIDDNYKSYYYNDLVISDEIRYSEEVMINEIIKFIVNSAKSFIALVCKDDYKTKESSKIMIDTIVSKYLLNKLFCPTIILYKDFYTVGGMYKDTMMQYLSIGTFIVFDMNTPPNATSIPAKYFYDSISFKICISDIAASIATDISVGLAVNFPTGKYFDKLRRRDNHIDAGMILNMFDEKKMDKAIIAFDVIASETDFPTDFVITYFLGSLIIRTVNALREVNCIDGIRDLHDLIREIVDKYKKSLKDMHNYDTDQFKIVFTSKDNHGSLLDTPSVWRIEDLFCSNDYDLSDKTHYAIYKDIIIDIETYTSNVDEYAILK